LRLNLPKTEDRGVLILALPRAASGETALDIFLKDVKSIKNQTGGAITLLFLSRDLKRRKDVKLCARLYRQKDHINTDIFIQNSQNG
jgi:hypothetical protein